MKTVKNPFILKSKSLGFSDGKCDTDRGTIQAAPPTMEVMIMQIEVEDLGCITDRYSFLDEKEIIVVFDDSHIWLDHDGNDFETYFSGEYEAIIEKVDIKEDSVILTIDLVCEIGL